MKLSTLFENNKFVLTSEVGPVKGCIRYNGGAEPDFLAEARLLKGVVDAVNVTDNQSAMMRLGSLAASIRLKEMDIEPIFQATCRDRNRIALQSDLLSACSLGIDNVLCLTGDYTSLGDHKSAKSVFDIDSVQLLKIGAGLNDGQDLMGNALTQSTSTCLGAVVNPNFVPMDLQLMKMEKKIEAGATFFQTQAVYDPAVFGEFADKAGAFKAPVQWGVVIVKSPEMGRYMNEHVSGITVPEWVIEEMGSVKSKADRKKKAVEITLKMAKEIKPMAQGIHFMPLGWSDVVKEVVENLD